MRHCHLIAYRRTGKDTLCQQLQARALRFQSEAHDRALWDVYARDAEACALPFLAATSDPIMRLAYADSLKRDVCDRNDIPLSILDDEAAKDLAIFEGKTFRQLLIERAADVREKDPLFYARIVARERARLQELQPRAVFVVTDRRYPEEQWRDAQTIRLFRKEVPIVKDISEHALDTMATDALLVPPAQFEDALRVFAQYKEYHRIGSLCLI